MILEYILLLAALVGSALAGIVDLKTTEIPDWIPHTMIGMGIAGNAAISILTGSYESIGLSLAFGIGFLAFGFFLYYTGQWGGGDAKILSSIGFLLPQLSINKSIFPFPLGFFFNVFFVGAVYMIGYTIILALSNKKIIENFLWRLKGSVKELVYLTVSIVAIIALAGFLAIKKLEFIELNQIAFFGSSILGISIFMFLLWKLTKSVEEVGFKRRIRISQLKEGDVLEDSKIWEGLSKKEVEKIKKSKRGYVIIKEGVRFAPTFFLALLATLLFGDIVLLIIL